MRRSPIIAGIGRAATVAAAVVAVLGLAGCSGNRVPNLMNLRSDTRGPDEFGIIPTKPLQMPDDLTALPEPTPGGASLTDPTPNADAIAALGGNPAVLGRSPAGDAAVLAAATRFGVTPDIRAALAAEDLDYRRKHTGRPLERLFGITVYYRAYLPMSLDQEAELARWRAAGIPTPSAPPYPQKK